MRMRVYSTDSTIFCDVYNTILGFESDEYYNVSRLENVYMQLCMQGFLYNFNIDHSLTGLDIVLKDGRGGIFMRDLYL